MLLTKAAGAVGLGSTSPRRSPHSRRSSSISSSVVLGLRLIKLRTERRLNEMLEKLLPMEKRFGDCALDGEQLGEDVIDMASDMLV